MHKPRGGSRKKGVHRRTRQNITLHIRISFIFKMYFSNKSTSFEAMKNILMWTFGSANVSMQKKGIQRIYTQLT